MRNGGRRGDRGDYGRGGRGDYGRGGRGNYGKGDRSNYGKGDHVDFVRGDRGDYGRVDRGDYGRVDRGDYGRVDRGDYGRVDRGDYGRVDRGDYGRGGRGDYGRGGRGDYGRGDRGGQGRGGRGAQGRGARGDFGGSKEQVPISANGEVKIVTTMFGTTVGVRTEAHKVPMLYRSSISVHFVDDPSKRVPTWMVCKGLECLMEHVNVPHRQYAHDGQAILVTLKELGSLYEAVFETASWQNPSSIKVQRPLCITTGSAAAGSKKEGKPRCLRVSVSPFPEDTRSVDLTPLQNRIRNGHGWIEAQESLEIATQTLAIIQAHASRTQFDNERKRNFFHAETITIPKSFKVLRMGHNQIPMLVKTDPSTAGYSWVTNINIICQAYVNSSSMLYFAEGIVGSPHVRWDSKDHYKIDCTLKAERLTVQTRYPNMLAGGRQIYRTYKAKGLGGPASMYKIPGKNTTVADYFMSNYGIQLEHPLLPLIDCSSDNSERFIPMELLEVAAQRSNEKTLTTEERAFIVRTMAMNPSDRLTKIKQARTAAFPKGNMLLDFGIQVDEQPVEATGRILQPCAITYGNGAKTIRDGKWNLQGSEFVDAAELGDKWAYVAFITRDNNRFNGKVADHEHFVQGLVSAAQKMRLRMSMPVAPMTPIDIYSNNGSYDIATAVERLCTFVEEYKRRVHSYPKIIVFSNPFERTYDQKTLYGLVKSKMDRLLPTQCYKTAGKAPLFKSSGGGDHQWYANILSKINVKLGGKCHTLCTQHSTSALSHLIGSDSSCLVLATDVTHPSMIEGDDVHITPSVLAVVGNADSTNIQFPFTSVRALPPRREVVEDFDIDVERILSQRLKANNKPITRVLYLRDGVGDGQFKQVLEQEVMAILRSFAAVGLPPPDVTAIVIQKRHNVRFFSKEAPRANLPPGTLLLHHLEHPSNFPNFWLISHASPQGTSRPARYFVLRNDLNISVEMLAQGCYELCHIFQRCQRAVSYPAPTYNAHLAAFRGKLHLGELLHHYSSARKSHQVCDAEEVLAKSNETLKNLKSSNCMFYS